MGKVTELRDIECFLIDLDGVLYRGSQPTPGADSFLALLRRAGRKFLLLTNNSTRTPEQNVDHLASMGIHISPAELLTSAQATAAYLATMVPAGTGVYFIGEDGVREALRQAGFMDAGMDATVVVVGLDRQLTYAKLRTAALAVRRGAQLIATNSDRTLPLEEGLVPGAGAILAAVETATDVRATVIGKPHRPMFDIALRQIGACPERTAIIGDRLDTDILGGHNAGLATILVLTGVARREEIEGAPVKPDWVFDNLEVLGQACARAWKMD